MHIAAAIEDPGAANGLIGLADALAEKRIDLRIYATGTAKAYAPAVELDTADFADLDLPFGGRDRPAAVLVGTSENPQSPVFDVTAAALAAGIPCFGFVDGPANAGRRFRGTGNNPLAHVPEYLLVSDPAAKDAFVSLGFGAGRIDIVGHLLVAPRCIAVGAEPVTAQMNGIDLVRLRHARQRRPEHVRRIDPAMEHDQRIAFAVDLIIELDAVNGDPV